MTGADSAHHHRIRQRVARRFTFPDGVDRIVTLSRWHWDTLDRLKVEMWFTDDEFAAVVFDFTNRFAQPHLDFETQLRMDFGSYIRGWAQEDERCANLNKLR